MTCLAWYENKETCEVSLYPLESSQKYWLNLAITGLLRADEISSGGYEIADGVAGG